MNTPTRFLIGMICCMTLFSALTSQASDTQRERRAFGESRTETFVVQPGGLLGVDSYAGDIVVNVRERNEVTVTVEGIEKNDVDNLDITQTGNVIRVNFRPKTRRWSSHIRFNIYIPSRYTLDLRTGGGDLELIGTLQGNIKGHTSGGEITLDDVLGMVDMNTSGGDIRTGRIQGAGYLRTSGGDIRVEDATEELDIQTSGGDITLGNIGKRLEAQTSGGDIIVGNIGGEARISTSGGDIDIRKVSGSANISTSGGTIQLRGASGDIRANTAGGDIELEDITGTVEARTGGGDIITELKPSGKGRSSLVTAAGDITLYIDGKAKATIEALIRVEGGWKGGRSRTRDRRDEDEVWRPGYEINADFRSQSYEEDKERGEIRAIYILNGGGERIWLETVNGHINIRESGQLRLK